MEVWNHFHTFLSLGRGDCEDHAILLCSLLLGFGLDAYVCVGAVRESTGATRDHVWVITRSRRGSSSSSSRTRVVFWETLTGQRYPHRLLSTGGSSSGGGGGSGGNGGGGGGDERDDKTSASTSSYVDVYKNDVLDEPMDITEQVDKLINDAQSHENLAQMYIGWCPFW